MHSTAQTVLLSSLIFSMTSCGNSGSSEAPPAKPPVYTGPAFSLAGLQTSTWKGECQPDGEKYSVVDHVHFEENTYWNTSTYFFGPGCDESLKQLTYQTNRHSAKLVEPDLVGWQTVSARVAGVTAVLYSQEVVSEFNRKAVFDYRDWAVSVEKDISSRRYYPSSEPRLSKDSVRYQTFKIENDVLYFARYKDNIPAESRDNPYKQVP